MSTTNIDMGRGQVFHGHVSVGNFTFGAREDSVDIRGANDYIVNGVPVNGNRLSITIQVTKPDGSTVKIPCDDLKVQIEAKCDRIIVETKSGSVQINAPLATGISISSSSGSVSVECANVRQCSSTTGDIHITASKVEQVESVSGHIICK